VRRVEGEERREKWRGAACMEEKRGRREKMGRGYYVLCVREREEEKKGKVKGNGRGSRVWGERNVWCAGNVRG
jgi:hypothetical protein